MVAFGVEPVTEMLRVAPLPPSTPQIEQNSGSEDDNWMDEDVLGHRRAVWSPTLVEVRHHSEIEIALCRA